MFIEEIKKATNPILDEPGFNPANPQPHRFRLEISKRGLPCLWESGGGMSNTGDAVIIAGIHGEPLAPIYIRRSGQLAGGQHALIPVAEGCLVIEASHHRGDFVIKISRLSGLRVSDPAGDGEYWPAYLVVEFSNGEWDDPDIAAAYTAAIEAAKGKATCYHCREPYFVKAQNVVCLDGQRRYYADHPVRIGVQDPVERRDLIQGEGPDMALSPGSFCVRHDDGRREIIHAGDACLYKIENGIVYERRSRKIDEEIAANKARMAAAGI